MALIITRKHSRLDLERWDLVRREAETVARTQKHQDRIGEAERALESFATTGCYTGVSWGKDSVVVADLAHGIAPLVWVKVWPRENPECEAVRDRFFAGRDQRQYTEIEVRCTWNGSQWVAPKGKGGLTSSAGFDEAAKRFGPRHISGVRADESSVRRLTVKRNGLSSSTTCRPIGHWSGMDVFAYLLTRGLPIHPAYGYTMDGRLDPVRLRVASLGGRRGDGVGRAEWERRYYRDEVSALSLGIDPSSRRPAY